MNHLILLLSLLLLNPLWGFLENPRVRLLETSLEVESHQYRQIFTYDSVGKIQQEFSVLGKDTLQIRDFIYENGELQKQKISGSVLDGAIEFQKLSQFETKVLHKKGEEILYVERRVFDSEGRLIEWHQNEDATPFRGIRTYLSSGGARDSLFEGGVLQRIEETEIVDGIELKRVFQVFESAEVPLSHQIYDSKKGQRKTYEGNENWVLLKEETILSNAAGFVSEILVRDFRGRESHKSFTYQIENELPAFPKDFQLELSPGLQTLSFALMDPDGDSLFVQLLEEWKEEFNLIARGDSLSLQGNFGTGEFQIPLEVTDAYGGIDTLYLYLKSESPSWTLDAHSEGFLSPDFPIPLPENGQDWTSIELYDFKGQRLQILGFGEKWPSTLPKGVYFYRIFNASVPLRSGSVIWKPKDEK